MNLAINLTKPLSTNLFSEIKIFSDDGDYLFNVFCELNDLYKLENTPSPIAQDLFLLGAVVYGLDRFFARKEFEDAWTRSFSFDLPVSNPGKWAETSTLLEQALSFLTGDDWKINFMKRKFDILVIEPKIPGISNSVNAISLFSGGADSLAGVIDWVEQNGIESLFLVGHHDPRVPGPLSDQSGTLYMMNRYYDSKLISFQQSVSTSHGIETSLRSRSLLFISIAVLIASQLSMQIPILIPENGVLGLNPALTPARRGSCSTRTAHPYFLAILQMIINKLGLENHLINPFEFMTKGEVLKYCKNRELLNLVLPYTTSCAKRGHKYTWVRKEARQCGKCIPCIYRRAALQSISLDNEIYGLDFCKGEIDIRSGLKYAEDLQSYLAFLSNDYSTNQLSNLLIANGNLDLSKIADYSQTIFRSTKEVRALLKEKAIPEILEASLPIRKQIK